MFFILSVMQLATLGRKLVNNESRIVEIICVHPCEFHEQSSGTTEGQFW